MVTIHRCDKCKAETSNSYNASVEGEWVDLCQECIEKLRKWIYG